jgi:epoxyqueuosine reductase
VLRQRLQRLAERILAEIGPFGYRVFVDSAPVLEKPLAAKAGLGWIGKHTNLIHPKAGSWFFLGEIYTDLALPIDTPIADHCGRCRACIEVCPTRAIVAPYQLDARLVHLLPDDRACRQHPGAAAPADGQPHLRLRRLPIGLPLESLRPARAEPDFQARHGLDTASLVEVFAWDEATFLDRTQGSAIRRIGHIRWLRNIAVALGNAPPRPEVKRPCSPRGPSGGLVREHVGWARRRLKAPAPTVIGARGRNNT